MKRILTFFAISALALPLFSQVDPGSVAVSAASRRTAIRYLQNAKQQAADKRWSEADSISQIGLEYDDSVADLWYIRAVSRHNLGDSRADVLPLVLNSLDKRRSQWVDYNEVNARILYADILSSTLRFKEALAVLDAEPFVYSADAEFIRVKCYYNLGDDALRNARSRVDTARKVYPSDIRFAELFYNYEYRNNFLESDGQLDFSVQRIADSFASSIRSGKYYKKVGDDLLLLSIVFTSDDSERSRLLRSFRAEGHDSVHFAEHALRNGILDDVSALDHFYRFSDNSASVPLNIEVLRSFASRLEDGKARGEFAEYLNSFAGTLLCDTDGDLESNMEIEYVRGRPQKISYDKNQDGVDDWRAECDFGVPQKVSLSESGLDLIYGSWPLVQTAVYHVKGARGGDSELSFSLLSDTLSWTPFEIEVDPRIKRDLSLDFFVPQVPDKVRRVSGAELLVSSSYYTMPSNERPNAFIQVSVLNGIPQNSNYYVSEDGKADAGNARLYAMAQFERGVPTVRLVDSDGDGVFETTETYGVSTDPSRRYISESDEMQVITNLFGAPASRTGFYVKMIELDQNGDTVPDFIEEYTEGLGKISSWDTDSDGNWDVKYVRHPSKSEKSPVKETALFHQPFTNEIVSVVTENGVPTSVSIGSKTRVSVFSGDISDKFFWIGKKDAETARAAEAAIARELSAENQGVSKIVQIRNPNDPKIDGLRFFAVKVGDRIYAQHVASN